MLAKHECRELRNDKLYQSVSECEAEGLRLASLSIDALEEAGYQIEGFTCRIIESNH